MRRKSLVALLVLAPMLIAGCRFFQVPPESQAVVTKYFQTVREGKLEDALTLYSPRFYEHTSRDKWRSMLEKIKQKLGTLQSYELTGWRVNRLAILPYPGTYSILTYRVKYAKYPADETITVYQPATGGEPEILGHNINSEGFILE